MVSMVTGHWLGGTLIQVRNYLFWKKDFAEQAQSDQDQEKNES